MKCVPSKPFRIRDILFSICEIYLLKREVFLKEIQSIVPDFDTLNMEDKLKILMCEICVNKTAKYLCEIYEKIQSIM